MSSRDLIAAFVRPSAIACVLLSAAGLARAQSATQTDVERLDIEEVVVTALKRSSKLQETPLSMLAVSGETLRDKGVDNVSDLLRSTPGLTVVDQGASQRRLVIRGVQSAGEAQTGLYYDETPVSGGSPSTTTIQVSACPRCACSTSSASKCCADRRAPCTARDRWAAPCAC